MGQNRIMAYIDGFNLFYGIRARGWKDLYWTNPHLLAVALAPSDATSVSTKYFTARVKNPDDKRNRQTRYLDAIRAMGESEIILGKFANRKVKCFECKHTWDKPEEKMTDSAIAAHLVADAFLDRFETAILIGGDTDIVPAVRMVRTHFSSKTLLAWYPPKRSNDAVGNVCHGAESINHDHLRAALMPDKVEVAEGVFVRRPIKWARPTDGETLFD